MDACMVKTYCKRMNQPGKVANPAINSGQLFKRERNEHFPVPVRARESWSRETDSAVPSRVSLLKLHTRG